MMFSTLSRNRKCVLRWLCCRAVALALSLRIATALMSLRHLVWTLVRSELGESPGRPAARKGMFYHLLLQEAHNEARKGNPQC
eukprot:s520_g18.t1